MLLLVWDEEVVLGLGRRVQGALERHSRWEWGALLRCRSNRRRERLLWSIRVRPCLDGVHGEGV